MKGIILAVPRHMCVLCLSEILSRMKTVNMLSFSIAGYITPETEAISHPGPKLKFLDEIKSLTEVAQELKANGVNKIIAIGHSGYDVDRNICEKVPGVDVVVGGHTNTFLWSGEIAVKADKEKVEGPYPTVVENVDGAKCLVVQDYAFGKYLGFLQVEFEENVCFMI